MDYFAAKDVHTGKIYHASYDWKNAFIVRDFCERLLREIPKKTIYIILDCWRAHSGIAMQIFAELNPRLKLVFLPTNASWMNEIERFFSHIERFVLRNSDFPDVRELLRGIAAFVKFGTWI